MLLLTGVPGASPASRPPRESSGYWAWTLANLETGVVCAMLLGWQLEATPLCLGRVHKLSGQGRLMQTCILVGSQPVAPQGVHSGLDSNHDTAAHVHTLQCIHSGVNIASQDDEKASDICAHMCRCGQNKDSGLLPMLMLLSIQ